jgi:signal transduction histidine kinase
MAPRGFHGRRVTLRAKFLLALTLISALSTSAVLLIVQYRVRIHVRGEIARSLDDSVVTFQRLQQERESSLQRTAALLATLPPLKAVMTSADSPTIQDTTKDFWELAGVPLFALTDRSGRMVALHAATPAFATASARASLERALGGGQSPAWWFVDGRLFELCLEPIYLGAPAAGHVLGMLAVGYEIDPRVAADVTRVASSEIGFGYEQALVLSTVAPSQREALARYLTQSMSGASGVNEIQLGDERFLAVSVRLSATQAPVVTLTFLKSIDRATAFLHNLNSWILALGIAAVGAGAVLVFLVSTTFTRPLGRLVAGVRALERGDFDYPLDLRGRDEVSALTAAFARMRGTLRDTQGRLITAERLATIGQIASTMSHDLRHPLTAVMAYAEFLAEGNLSDAQRKDFFEEIRIAVNHMLDEVNSLLGFSKESEAARPVHAPPDVVIERSIKAVKALPEFASIAITYGGVGGCVGWFDMAKLERVILNLLFNAAEAVAPESGRIEVNCRVSEAGTEIRVVDNGPGIPAEIAGSLFQPFVSAGKEKGIGLGLTAVHSIMQQHHGDVSVERTGPDGTVFLLFFPAPPADV